MREIKFRAWDVLNKIILQWDDIFNFPAWEIFPGTPEQRPFEIMQYTGLKDKNGKEIYEGDIVISKNYHNIDSTEIENDKSIVKFIDGSFCVILQDVNNTEIPIALLSMSGNIEVIGNIYENPELLKEL